MTKRKHITHPEQTKMSESIVDMLIGLPVKTAMEILDRAKSHMLWCATVDKPEYAAPNGLNQIDLEEAIKAQADLERNGVVPLKTRKRATRK